MTSETLSHAILAAETEKAIWMLGRKAFQRNGLGAFNPYELADKTQRDLWIEGFNYEQEIRAAREPRF
ncbi:hypothetical protein [Jiella marina]|uniref:hypothetical protein n=1 Tax=Jiella sp. LLJ827 TaxID=2917712 RepID=UPI002100BD79|nr:hypothetical protein [Jiella sp. LLJ827]MCQ0987509.1 hypothetical protein [Jiella sp. LLJ827]